MKTSNANLQNKLDTLVQLMDASLAEESKTPARLQKLMIFTDAFVPPDVQPEDIAYFSDNLYQDEEYLQSMRREVGCCASGELIESITGNQRTKAVFTILPPEGTRELLLRFDFQLLYALPMSQIFHSHIRMEPYE
jgi:hypothetical protein